MRRHLQQVSGQLVTGWFLAAVATTVYLLTLEPSVSFWDSGEFIAVSYLLQVGHPPGAPFYQLLAHIFSWFSFGNPLLVAPCINALSAVAGGLTVMFLYWTILLLKPGGRKMHAAALVGSLCYLFCDTAWFSAVESEVYSLAMLIASIILWAMLRWYHSPATNRQSQRWLLLIALLLGLGTCTHLLTLLTTPVLLLLFLFKWFELKKSGSLRGFFPPAVPLFMLFFFVIGLSLYLIIPIRSTAGTPINENHPSTLHDFKAYVTRGQYEKAPIYPRIWRHHENDARYAADWSGGDTTLMGNLTYYGSYQLTYMYIRYLMWNFSGRYNDRQGYGSPQNGQFLTGVPPIDRLLVGTAARPPDSLHTRGHNVYYMLPLLLGLIGLVELYKKRKAFWTVTLLFLMGGFALSIYLNHPTYEPRERDYAYILSFYAFCIYIAFGAEWILSISKKYKPRAKKSGSHILTLGSFLLLLMVPALMAFQNWDDHDRSHRYIAHDAATNILRSCDRHPSGAVLFTYGDNDTFPLWYMQTVEEERTDVRVENIGLMGWKRFTDLLVESMQQGRPVYFSHYAYNQYNSLFGRRFQLEGNAYRLMPHECDSVAVEPFLCHLSEMEWHSLEGVYIDEIGCKFLEQYWRDVLLLAENLSVQGQYMEATAALHKTLSEIPLSALQDVRLVYSTGQACLHAGDTATCDSIIHYLHGILSEQLDYYHTIAPDRQSLMPYTLEPREQLWQLLQTNN